MLTNGNILKQKIDALWDKFWSGGISNPLTAIEQMSYLIFLKRLVDNDNTNAAMAKRRNEKFISVFKGNEKCRWSYWSQLPGDQMLRHIRDTVFEFLRNLGSETSTFTQHMQDAYFALPKASLLQEAVNIIEDLHITEQNIDVQGDLYEYLLGQLATAGKNGQFRTPRHIIRMMVKLVDPKIGDRICDPACGTSGFLFNAYMHILEQNTSNDVLEYDEEGMPHHLIGDKITDKKLFKFLKIHALTGYDFDSTMTRIGAMNLMLHGIDNPNIKYTDTLSKSYNDKEMYDIVLANPPFKGSIDETDVNPRFKTKTKKTELLFVELIYDLLVTGGRAAVIVPDGVLFGTSNAHIDIRKILIDKCKLEGIISMPSGVFKPYAGVSTAIVVFQKGGTTDNVWFYDMAGDGFTLDDKRNKSDKNDIPDIVKHWTVSRISDSTKARNGVSDYKKAILVDVNDIKANKYDLSISRYKPVVYEEVVYEKPDLIMEKVLSLEKEITVDINSIKKLLSK
ncbi:MAG: class I SAM-dependent DNA methyltransferase [Ignavibacteria bacterium]|nr:class I SAM-dependent DNA methyltransferase [Ignavibacteria bacterium]